MHLARFERRRYTPGPTPLEPMPRLSEHLGGPQLWVKRDDLLGLTAGGNKTRKLEFLMADALARGADTIVTTGAVQSNHCRLTLAAAVREGLSCHLLLEERVPGSYDPDSSGNNLLFRLLGAERVEVVPGGTDLESAMEQLADDVRRQGGTPQVIPGGGSTPLGALGYVSCAEEILAQSFDAGLRIDHVVCASGSGGTHAGLAAGLWGTSSGIPLTGISVRGEREAQQAKLRDLAGETARLCGISGDLPHDAIVVDDSYVGPGYSLPTPEMTEAIQLFARTEGLLLDPVYTGKAAAGLVGLVREGRFDRDEHVVFLHTGGAPACFAYPESVLGAADA